MKNRGKVLLLALIVLLAAFVPAVKARALTTDVMDRLGITVDVNDDASLLMTYEIEWTVLDDEEYGPLTWIDLGVPNSYHSSITPLTDSIDHIEDNGNSLAIYLDRSYYADETVTLSFSMIQDHMYQIDKYAAGETVYTFTPAWFDSMEIRNLEIRWNMANAASWQPDCLMDGDYLSFSASLGEGEKYTMSVTYPNDAFGFSVDRQAGSGSSGYDSEGDPDLEPEINFPSGSQSFRDTIETLLGGLIALIFTPLTFAAPIVGLFFFIRWISRGTGFGSTATTEKKITRTKIEYYANCPNCGAPRQEGKEKCVYCGRDMIKSKEVVQENQIEKPENYTKNGTYRYGSSPNTYIMVHVVNVPVRHSSTDRSHSSSSSSRSSRSSCAHSSCACACASSCACACACASSGRAGCSVKDFFRESIHKGRIRVESRRASKS